MATVTQQLESVKRTIETTASRQGRDKSDVQLLAVSKTQPVSAILEAADAGQLAFGENYEQEAVAKIHQIKQLRPDLNLTWHFIGPIQSNKTRAIAENFDWVHSVDRERIARRLSEQRPEHLPDLNICLQVNISGEATKSGVKPEEVMMLAQTVRELPRLKLRGLMAIPEPGVDESEKAKPFHEMKLLFNQLQSAGFDIDTLSMGMSADMNEAIAEGATIVRIGTAIFGQRNYNK